MAETSISVDQDQFNCVICLDLLKDPVTIPCGHSYCMGCIKGYWDQDGTGVYSCPHCRKTFTPKPLLKKNTILAEVVEKLKKTGLQAAPPAHCYAGPGDVACDVCTGRKRKPVKSCLMCLASYCETHLQPHYESPAFKKHKLVKATGNLQEKICSHHNKLLEVYCRTDQQFICLLCVLDEHRGHDTVSAAAARTDKQKQLGATQSKLQQRIQEREKELQDLRRAGQSRRRSPRRAVKAEVSRVEGLRERLEQEIVELRQRAAELEQLSHIEDHIKFLQGCQSLCVPPGPGDLPSITASPSMFFVAVKKSVSEPKDKLEDVCKEEVLKVSESVRQYRAVQPRTRQDFLQYSCPLTLDPNTAFKRLRLSEGNREATHVEEIQSYPDHPERFKGCNQVLCREGLSGRCYWEAEWTGYWFGIGVTYKDISRNGYDGHLEHNTTSWCLRCSPFGYSLWHNHKYIDIPVPSNCLRIGAYLDHRAGTLSFYSISDTMTLLCGVKTTFTQPLYPGFWVYKVGSSVKLCDL